MNDSEVHMYTVFDYGMGNDGLSNRDSAVFIIGAHVCLNMCNSKGILYLPERLTVL